MPFILATLVMTAVSMPAQAKTSDLARIAADVHNYMRNDSALNPETCAADLTALVRQVTAFDSSGLGRHDLRSYANAIVHDLWSSRLLLRKKMIRFHQQGNLPADCVRGMRNAFRAFRFMEEYAGLHALPKGAWVDPKPQRVFSGGFPAFVHAPSFDQLQFKSGDILVSYGMAYGSAAIAHIGEDGGTFSHLAMVYVDPRGEVFTIEAHPEFGVKVAPLAKYMNDGKGRSALFRHPDTELASAAGKTIYELAYAADSRGRPIPYDFTMDLQNHQSLFCTETASYAYDMAARQLGRAAHLPTFPTRITMKDPYIIDAFDIKTRLTFAPSDIEVDPQFEMLAEWRDLGRARLMHHQQAALEMEFKWLDQLNYGYRTDLGTGLQSRLLHTMRRLPLFSGLVDDMIPPDLSQKALQAVVNVYVTSDIILEKLIARDRLLENKSRGTLMTMKEILRHLEVIRTEDLRSYRLYQMELQFPTGENGRREMPADQFHWHLRARDL